MTAGERTPIYFIKGVFATVNAVVSFGFFFNFHVSVCKLKKRDLTTQTRTVFRAKFLWCDNKTEELWHFYSFSFCAVPGVENFMKVITVKVAVKNSTYLFLLALFVSLKLSSFAVI